MIPPASLYLGERVSEKPPRKKRKTKKDVVEPAEPEPEPDNSLPPQHKIFQDWAVSKGVEIHPSITPAKIPNRGIGLQATDHIPKGTRIIFVPEKAIFKPFKYDQDRNKQQWDRSAQASLAWAARNCMTDPDLQKWSATWPSERELRASLPLFWPKQLQSLLPPSTLAVLRRQEADYKRDLKESGQSEGGVLDYTWMIVNSRSFYWDPIGRQPGYMVLCPFIDYFNHGPEGTGVIVRQTPKGYEVWTNMQYTPGEELLLTYGAHSNDKLLVHYGFTHAVKSKKEPSDDSILLDHVMITIDTTDEVLTSLSSTGYLGNYNLTPKTGRVCHRTQVAVRAMICAANEWEYFILNGEDMGRSRWGDVGKWLGPRFDEYLDHVSTALRKLEWWRKKDKYSYQVALARQRWMQIAKALEVRGPLSRGEV